LVDRSEDVVGSGRTVRVLIVEDLLRSQIDAEGVAERILDLPAGLGNRQLHDATARIRVYGVSLVGLRVVVVAAEDVVSTDLRVGKGDQFALDRPDLLRHRRVGCGGLGAGCALSRQSQCILDQLLGARNGLLSCSHLRGDIV